MKKNFEIVEYKGQEIVVDLRQLIKKDVLSFNATQLAKAFGKRPDDYLKTKQTKAYIEALKARYEHIRNELVVVKRGGKYQGTWLHQKLALDFARWLSPDLAVRLDEYTMEKLREADRWRNSRYDTKTGYRPLTDAVQKAHKNPQSFHYSNEANMINRIVFGLTAKQYNEKYGLAPRDGASEEELVILERLQSTNADLIELGFDFQTRKEMLQELYDKCTKKKLKASGKLKEITHAQA